MTLQRKGEFLVGVNAALFVINAVNGCWQASGAIVNRSSLHGGLALMCFAAAFISGIIAVNSFRFWRKSARCDAIHKRWREAIKRGDMIAAEHYAEQSEAVIADMKR